MTRMPHWYDLIGLPVIEHDDGTALRIDTGDFQLWTAVCHIGIAVPDRTVYVKWFNPYPNLDQLPGWADLASYNGFDPPSEFPGMTRNAFIAFAEIVPNPWGKK